MTNIGDQSSHTLLISDLHLCVSRPNITAAFLDFLQNTATKADALYILGDLFEYWAGDDAMEDAYHNIIIRAFLALANSGVNVYFMHGNRDFLISDGFCNAANITLLTDPTCITLYGQKVLLSHGDALCTDDAAYMQFRSQVRNAQWQADFLGQPLAERKRQIEALRMRSEQEKTRKAANIMDINPKALADLLAEYDYPAFFIHGHTHRPNEHQLQLDGHNITRWVLGDWYEQGSYLRFDAKGCRSVPLIAAI
ncbi:MAG TPA: UDP-2,3-diacylglucosamine diphosphatase [Methylotenera sp.]|nr:UDP-2,3-diacylglucosamine diphosphatase [Methylotenera sp.]